MANATFIKSEKNRIFYGMMADGLSPRGAAKEAIAFASTLTFTFDNMRSMYMVAASECQQYGASEKQINYYISLLESDGQTPDSRQISKLSRKEMSAMINYQLSN